MSWKRIWCSWWTDEDVVSLRFFKRACSVILGRKLSPALSVFEIYITTLVQRRQTHLKRQAVSRTLQNVQMRLIHCDQHTTRKWTKEEPSWKWGKTPSFFFFIFITRHLLTDHASNRSCLVKPQIIDYTALLLVNWSTEIHICSSKSKTELMHIMSLMHSAKQM